MIENYLEITPKPKRIPPEAFPEYPEIANKPVNPLPIADVSQESLVVSAPAGVKTKQLRQGMTWGLYTLLVSVLGCFCCIVASFSWRFFLVCCLCVCLLSFAWFS